jgi:hypothetical protein
MRSVLHKIPELHGRLKNTEEQGKLLSDEMPEHHATIEMGLQQLYDKWKNVNEEIGTQDVKLMSAKEYFQFIEKTEMFLREANKNLLEWSKKLSCHRSETDVTDVLLDIENYISKHKASQNEMLVRMTAAAGQVFGSSAFQKTQVVQKEQEETFDALNTLLLQAKDTLAKLKLEEANKLQEATASKTVTHHTQTENDSPPPRPPLPILIPLISSPPQGPYIYN